jgi:hypothetical protein
MAIRFVTHCHDFKCSGTAIARSRTRRKQMRKEAANQLAIEFCC